MTYTILYSLQVIAVCELAYLLCARKAYRSQPAFCAFIGFSAAINLSAAVMGFVLQVSYSTWHWLPRIETVGNQVLGAWVAASLLWDVYFPVVALSRKVITRWLMAVPVLAIWALLLAPRQPLLELRAIVEWMLLGCFLISVLAFTSQRAYMSRWGFGIGTGFLTLQALGAIRSLAVSHLGQGDFALMVSYTLACAIWIYHFARKDEPLQVKSSDEQIRRAQEVLHRMNRRDVLVADYRAYGCDVLIHWHAPGIATTFSARPVQIQELSQVATWEGLKYAAFERAEQTMSKKQARSNAAKERPCTNSIPA